MSIGKQIIYASSFVGLLALLGCYIGWSSTSDMQTNLTICTEQSIANSKSLRIAQEALLQAHQKMLSGQNASANIAQLADNAQFIKKFDEVQGQQLLEISREFRALNQQEQTVTLDRVRPLTYLGANTIAQGHEQNELRIEQQSKDIRRNISALKAWIVGICLIMSIVAVALGRLIANGLSTSWGSLEEAAFKLRQGDFSHRVALKSRNEFGKLGRTFNTLADSAEQGEIIEKQKDELQFLNEQLKLKNDSLDSFVYRVSHDLKAPLVNILSLQNIVKSKIDLSSDEVLNKSFGFMEKNSLKLQQTIHDLLEVTRIERRLENDKTQVSFEEILDKVLEENIEDIERSKTQMEINFAESTHVYFNAANLKSILANLVTNAIKYRKTSGQNVIKISTHTDGKFVNLTIADNGVGLDLDKHRDKLFGIFNRFHNHVEGSGVGLYIVKKLIEENGGSLEMESAVGVGTTFNVRFLEEQEVAVEVG